MKLYQISEPKQEEIVVGIDLGTTNSLIGYYESEKVQIISDRYNEAGVVPSVIAYTEDCVKVGHEALECDNSIHSVKRLIGKGLNDSIGEEYNIDRENSSESIVKLKIGEKTLSPIEISSEILKYLKKNAENYTGKAVNKAVITVPAHFDDAARTATRDAARIAGIEVLRILNEPTAAAIAYGIDSNENEATLVYDLGGGTFDVSILRKNHGVMVVLATGGNNNLGGDDFDREILKLLCEKAKREFSLKELNTAIECKKYLSENSLWQGNFSGVNLSISRTEMVKSCQKLIDQTLTITKRVIFDSGLSLRDITNVILAGGATRMPVIKEEIEKMFQRKPLSHINPDQVVCIGAVMQAKSMTHGGDVLVDVLPLSLGIELLGGIVEPIIPRNTAIPASVKKFYTTYKDNQTGFQIHVVQGEGNTVNQCRSLAKFELSGITPKPAGEVKLEVSFKVNSSGILVVSATELDTGKSYEVEVKPSYGLSEEEILRLIQ